MARSSLIGVKLPDGKIKAVKQYYVDLYVRGSELMKSCNTYEKALQYVSSEDNTEDEIWEFNDIVDFWRFGIDLDYIEHWFLFSNGHWNILGGGEWADLSNFLLPEHVKMNNIIQNYIDGVH